MKLQQLEKILDKIKTVNVAVYGDFCLDAYWILAPQGGEISVETGLKAQAVSKHYYTLGGASNVVANIMALKPAAVRAIGVVGNDIFGNELLKQLRAIGADTTAMVIQKQNYNTVTFAKRYLEDNEQPRIDFGFFNKRTKQTDDVLIENIKDALEKCDALIFNQQVPGSLNNEEFIRKVNQLFDDFSDKIILFDSRHYGRSFRNTYRKTNDIEAAKLNGIGADRDDIIMLDNAGKYASNLYKQSLKPVFLTRGARGMIVVDKDGTHEIPGIQIMKRTDTVGAGDTVISALGLCLAGGFAPVEAAEFANYAAVVTVQKLFQTGTANDEEILEVCKNAIFLKN